jgi:hypothetical protein
MSDSRVTRKSLLSLVILLSISLLPFKANADVPLPLDQEVSIPAPRWAFTIRNKDTGRVICGSAISDAGLWGTSTSGNGVVGVSAGSDAIAGYAEAGRRSGVFGKNTFAGSGGEFELPAYGVTGQALGPTGRGVYGVGGAYGVYGETSTAAPGVFGTSTSGCGVHGVARSSSAGVRAENVNVTGPALEITRGTVVVAGAGLNTNTSAFRVRNSAAQTVGIVIIDNSRINEDDSAILIVTPRWPSGTLAPVPVAVCFGCAGPASRNRWVIANSGNDGIPPGMEFNVLAIKTH